MEIHPAAMLFPTMTEAELSELAKDIKENGLLETIMLCDGKILDGRNREAACRIAGVEPRFVEANGVVKSPVIYVLSKNLHRRHLTVSQRAAIAAELLPMLQEESKAHRADRQSSCRNLQDDFPKGSSREVAAKHVGVSGWSVQQAASIRHEDPALYERIKVGEETIQSARRKLAGLPTPNPRGTTQKLQKADRIEKIRKLAATGCRSQQIAKQVGIGDEHVRLLARENGIKLPDVVVGNSRRPDSNRIVSQTVIGAAGLVSGLELVEPSELDRSQTADWVRSLTDSIAGLNGLLRQLRRIA